MEEREVAESTFSARERDVNALEGLQKGPGRYKKAQTKLNLRGVQRGQTEMGGRQAVCHQWRICMRLRVKSSS